MAEIKASIVDFIKGLKGEPTGNPEDNMTEEQKAEYHREANRFNNGDGTGTITRKLTNDEIRKYSNQANEAGRAIAYKEMAFALEKRAPWIAEKTYGKDNLAQMHKDYDGDVARRKEANDILKKGSIDVKVKIGTDGKVAGEIQADGSVTAVQPATSKAYQAGQAVRGALGKGKKLSQDKKDAIIRVARNIGVDPNDLAAVISFETGGTFSPSAKNPNSSGSGLIQFMEATAKGLGTTTANLRAMSFDEQMNYVQKYFEKRGFRGNKKRDIGDLYTAVTGSGYRKGSKAYELNKVWDSNGDGFIAPREMVNNKSFKAHQKDYFGGDWSDNQQPQQVQLKTYRGAADKYTPKISISTPTPTVMNTPVVNIPSFNYTVPEIQVASASVKPIRLNSDNSKAQMIQPTKLVSQNLNDRLLAHVATGGIGADYRA